MLPAWFRAAYDGDAATLKALLAQGVDVNSWEITAAHQGVTALHHATSNAHVECVRLLIASGADVNADYDKTPGHRAWTPLLCVVEGQTGGDPSDDEDLEAVEVVRLLLENGANPNARHFSTALEMAEGYGLESITRLLRQMRVRESSGRTQCSPLLNSRTGHAERGFTDD